MRLSAMSRPFGSCVDPTKSPTRFSAFTCSRLPRSYSKLGSQCWTGYALAAGIEGDDSAEKLFKAWLAVLGEVYPLTHNIERLFDLLADQGVFVEPFRKLIDYTPYAVEFCYTGVDSSTEAIDRAGALAIVESLLEQVQRRLAEVEGV